MKRKSILYPLATFSVVASSLTSVYACHNTTDGLPADKDEEAERRKKYHHDLTLYSSTRMISATVT